MNFFKRKHPLRRYFAPKIVRGHQITPYDDWMLPADVQTMENVSITTEDGAKSLQTLKVFCDLKLFTDEEETQQKADRLWFQDKWFSCNSCRLSENTPLKHWTATFIECLDKEEPLESVQQKGEDSQDVSTGADAAVGSEEKEDGGS